MMRLLGSSFFLLGLALAMAPPDLASAQARVVTQTFLIENKCLQVCNQHMWWQKQSERVRNASDRCFSHIHTGYQHEGSSMFARHRGDQAAANRYTGMATIEVRQFVECVNEVIRQQRGFQLDARQDRLDSDLTYGPPKMTAKHFRTFVEGAPIRLRIEGDKHRPLDFIEGDLAPESGYPLRFVRARGQILLTWRLGGRASFRASSPRRASSSPARPKRPRSRRTRPG
jgi:hypothetical protein